MTLRALLMVSLRARAAEHLHLAAAYRDANDDVGAHGREMAAAAVNEIAIAVLGAPILRIADTPPGYVLTDEA